MFRPLTGLAVSLACLTLPAFAQETPSDSLLTVNHYLDYETVADPRLSPDAKQIIRSEEHTSELQSPI